MYQNVNRLRSTVAARIKSIIMKLLEYFKQFPDEQSCLDYFHEQLHNFAITCGLCKGTIHYWIKMIGQFQCKDCRTRTTLRSGTVIESSNLSFRDWFVTMHLMIYTKKGISAKEIQLQLGFKQYEPVWFMMHKIRVGRRILYNG